MAPSSHGSGADQRQKCFYGTRDPLQPWQRIHPRRSPDSGPDTDPQAFILLTRSLDEATWAAELDEGDGPGRVYIVEPTGLFEDDPNLTNKKFRSNPTKSFRSRSPLRVTGEVTTWQGHALEAIQAMKDGLARLQQLGEDVIDD